MLDNVYIIKRQSQVKALGAELKLSIIRNLMEEPLTCQQLADKLETSKQKVHYNLKSLLEEELINQKDGIGNDKEKHYRAKARNYVIDFSLGNEISSELNNGNRALIRKIIEQEHGLDLGRIARGIVNSSIKLKPEERVLIVTGRFNMPLVEMIQTAVAELGAEATILYRDQDFLHEKHCEFSLEAFQRDYDNFLRLLSENDVYLYLNGESRYISCTDKAKQQVRQDAQIKSLEIIKARGIRVVMMPGLLNDALNEDNIKSEISFWRALDVDYARLREDTDSMIKEFYDNKEIVVRKQGSEFKAKIHSIFGEYGSFGESPYQSFTINLPGGEVLLIPQKGSMSGTIRGSKAYINGIQILKPVVEIENNRIVKFRAEKQEELIGTAIEEGGEDGAEIALICLGTNYGIETNCQDLQHVNKSKGLLTVYWGNNTMMGGEVKGQLEWQIQIEKPIIKKR
ncbi:MAG: aminopeptidase [Candidatus Cloacimonetes bacterium]|nr:aminopeptidase [Candidatus Cloacimonadota bacterium]